VTFDASQRMPNGLIFVDTPSGASVNPDAATPAAELASVEIGPGAPADASGRWSGWLVVNGSVAMQGGVRMNGYVHARSAVSYRGPGSGGFAGAIVSRGLDETAASAVDGGSGGPLAIVYDCRAARTGGGTIPGRWALKSGSYKEVSGS
jgi:hypothetical protein